MERYEYNFNNLIETKLMKYLFTVLKHKWYVFVIGRKLKVSTWRLIKHDWTKFLPCEFIPYYNKFQKSIDNKIEFEKAWNHHCNHNDHHQQYWINTFGINYMPEDAIKEMVADWMAACKAYEGIYPWECDWKWWTDNKDDIKKSFTISGYNNIKKSLLICGAIDVKEFETL